MILVIVEIIVIVVVVVVIIVIVVIVRVRVRVRVTVIAIVIVNNTRADQGVTDFAGAVGVACGAVRALGVVCGAAGLLRRAESTALSEPSESFCTPQAPWVVLGSFIGASRLAVSALECASQRSHVPLERFARGRLVRVVSFLGQFHGGQEIYRWSRRISGIVRIVCLAWQNPVVAQSNFADKMAGPANRLLNSLLTCVRFQMGAHLK